jgi:hypothetical protein
MSHGGRSGPESPAAANIAASAFFRALALAAALAACSAFSQAPQDPATLIAAQRKAMAALSFMDGVWRGPAWTLQPSGEKRMITQTERIGAFLDGSVKVIEGRGYRADSSVGFNALGIISYDPAKKTYAMRSYAMGRAGDFAFTPLPDGYTWETPAGPGAVIRYTATVKGDSLLEVGDRIVAGQDPVRIFEMELKRIADTSWPAGDPVPAR